MELRFGLACASILFVNHLELSHADELPVINRKIAAMLSRADWHTPAMQFQSREITVVTALKDNVKHAVIVGKGRKLVDLGILDTTQTVHVSDSSLRKFSEIQIQRMTPQPAGVYEETNDLFLIRPNGSISCQLEGARGSHGGSGCGLNSWTSVTFLPVLDRAGRAKSNSMVDVETAQTFMLSVPNGKGMCDNAEPPPTIRNTTRYQLSPTQLCKVVRSPR
jgi:hypothetical protein